MPYCKFCHQYIQTNGKYEIKHNCEKAGLLDSKKDDSFLTSAIIGAVTGSAILGGLLGGDIVGGMLGDMLDGDLMD